MKLGWRGDFTKEQWRRLLGLGTAGAAAIGLSLVLRSWIWVIPRSIRRFVADVFLYALLYVYALILVAAPLGVIVAGILVVRARRRGLFRPDYARLLSLSVSCLLGLGLLDASASAWLAWTHRAPSLPELQALPDPSPKLPRLPTEFDEESSLKTAGSGSDNAAPLELVVLGESSARGEPYDPWLSIGQILEWQLSGIFPERRVHAEILAISGATLEWQHQRLETITRRPDALIVYAGHNEFQSRYRWERIQAVGSAEQPRRRFEIPTPLARLVREVIARNGIDVAPPPKVVRRLDDWPVCTPAEYATIRADFERRIEAIVEFCERLGAVPILVIPPGNDAGFEPNRSVPARLLSNRESRAFEREFFGLLKIEKSDPAAVMNGYRAILDRHPRFAEAHYRLARLLENAGRFDEAYDHYIVARDSDGLPQRCPTDFQECYRVVAARHPRVVLIDGQAVFRALSPRGILDDRFFHDAQHPVLLGHIALAQAVLDALADRGALGWPEDRRPSLIDPAECAEQFNLSPACWAVVCNRAASFFERTAFLCRDPRHRLDLAARDRDAARAIEAGVAPERAGIPGVGITPDDRARLAASRHSEHRIDERRHAGR
jgi:hypothetical protein